ncbi:hypothetical protein ACJX0J_021885 [Zea mays]
MSYENRNRYFVRDLKVVRYLQEQVNELKDRATTAVTSSFAYAWVCFSGLRTHKSPSNEQESAIVPFTQGPLKPVQLLLNAISLKVALFLAGFVNVQNILVTQEGLKVEQQSEHDPSAQGL